MAQNLASLKLTAANMTALNGALDTIRTTLGDRAVSLSVSQRQTLTKMGDKSRPFCQQGIAALQANAASLPPDVNVTELSDDLADFEKLAPFFDQYNQVGELIDDTLKAISSDVMINTIAG